MLILFNLTKRYSSFLILLKRDYTILKSSKHKSKDHSFLIFQKKISFLDRQEVE